MAIILDGKKTAAEMTEELKARVAKLKAKFKLCIINIGNSYANEVYVRMKCKKCEEVGLIPQLIHYGEEAATEEVYQKILELNNDDTVCGIMLQHPSPKHINEDKLFNAIAVGKDVDGLSKESVASISIGKPLYAPATPKGIITLLKRYQIPISGKHAVVVGRSRIVGKPLAELLLAENATVTICHSRTQNLAEMVGLGDIVCGALGKPEYIQTAWLKKGAVVIDAGYNEGNKGDVQFEGLDNVASAYTPVPGGAGPMTIISLLEQCVDSAERR